MSDISADLRPCHPASELEEIDDGSALGNEQDVVEERLESLLPRECKGLSVDNAGVAPVGAVIRVSIKNAPHVAFAPGTMYCLEQAASPVFVKVLQGQFPVRCPGVDPAKNWLLQSQLEPYDFTQYSAGVQS